MKYKVGGKFIGINGSDEHFTGEIVGISDNRTEYFIIWSDVGTGLTPITFRERELDHIVGTEHIVYVPKPKPLPEELFTI
jgi:hypothetical protein